MVRISAIALACLLAVAGAGAAMGGGQATGAPAKAAAAGRLYAVRFQPGAAWDKSKPPAEQTGFAVHSANLQRLRGDGAILFGGRFADLGLIVVRAPDATAARQLFAGDSTLEAGVFTIQIDAWSTIFDGCTR